MNDRSTRATAVIVVLIIAASVFVPFVGLVAAVPDARIAVTGVTVTPATPTAGAPVTAEVTVRLSAGSDSAADLDRVAVVDADGTVLGRATDLGTLSPGETLTVPVTLTFDSAGAYDLSVVATVSDSDDETATASRPLSVVVEQGAPLVELDVPTAVAGVDSRVEVTVSNPTTAPLREFSVTVVDPVEGDRLRRTVATLDAGASQTLNFSVRPENAGEQAFRVRVDYTTAAGTRSSFVHERSVVVAPLAADVGIRVARASADGGQAAAGGGGAAGLAGLFGGAGGGALQPSTGEGSEQSGDGARVDVTVTNFGNAPVERVVLVPRDENGSVVAAVGRVAVADSLASGAEATVTVDLSAVETSGVITFVAQYDLGGERREAAVAYDFRPARGAVELTGLNVTLGEDGRVTVEGNVGNVGGSEVTGVVVGVAASEFVAPAYPQRTYFVGSVGASEFAPFGVTATADVANATTIPVQVAYTTGDDRVTTVVDVPLPPPAESSGRRIGAIGGFGGFGTLGAILLAVGLAVPVAVGLLARRYA